MEFTPAGSSETVEIETFALPPQYVPKREDKVIVLDPSTYRPSTKFPGVWTVVKVNPRRAIIVGAGDRRLNCDHSLMQPATEADQRTDVPTARIPFNQGAIVRWTAAPAKAQSELFVVIKDDGGPTVGQIVKLGGDAGRYWRRVPAVQLAPVSLNELAKSLGL